MAYISPRSVCLPLALFILAFATTQVALAEAAVKTETDLRLGAPFTDHMVFQADAPVRIWGWDLPQTPITVTLAGHSANAKAGNDGQWSVTLPAVSAVGPYELIVAGSQTLTLSDVVAGEVWWCSGQSNMVWPISKSGGKNWVLKQEANPDIRLFTVPNRNSNTPEGDADAQWQISGPDTLPNFSAVAYFFGRRLSGQVERPVGLMVAAWGGSKIRAWLPPDVLAASPHYDELKSQRENQVEKFETAFAEWEAGGKKGVRPPVNGSGPQHSLSGLANGMTHPLIPYSIRGVLWYQGEADTWDPQQYDDLFTDLILSWREDFANPELPVYFVQLPNFRKGEARWPFFRDMQRRLAKRMDNVEMVVTIDIGEANDIHPSNKKDVGDRLVQLALVETYGKNIPAGSPRPVSITLDPQQSGRVLIEFDRVADGLKTSDKQDLLTGFVLVAADGQTRQEAKAQIISANTVALTAVDIPVPAEVRYANLADPKVNLVNSKGYPVTPFIEAISESGAGVEPQ